MHERERRRVGGGMEGGGAQSESESKSEIESEIESEIDVDREGRKDGGREKGIFQETQLFDEKRKSCRASGGECRYRGHAREFGHEFSS